MRLQPNLPALPVVLSAVFACVAATPAGAQSTFQSVPFDLSSGILSNPGPGTARVWEQEIVVAGAESLQVVFAAADLGGDEDRVVVRNPLDGEVQALDRLNLKRWRWHSGHFRGDRVVVALDLASGSTGLVVIQEVIAQFPGPYADTLCASDDRTSSSDDRVCRLRVSSTDQTEACTGFLVSDRSVIVTAGHCNDAPSLLVLAEFRVPASNGSGTMNPPGIADQYPVDLASIQSNNLAIGDDWATARLHPNSSGETAASRYGWFTMAASVPIGVTGYTVRVTGYGNDTTPLTSNRTQQTATGPLTGSVGPLRHQVDTEPCNSGSPIIRESTGEVIGIHTNGGCTASPSSYNSGTSIRVFGLQAAISRNAGCAGYTLADSTATLTCTSAIFNVFPTAGMWNIVGVSSPADWDIAIESSSSAGSSSAADFLVANGHLGSMPPRAGVASFGLTIGPVSYPATLEHETGGGLPVGESICTTFLAGQVVDLYELTVTAPGLYTVNVTGSSTLKWNLYAPGADASWRPRSSSIAAGTAGSSGPATVPLVAGTYALVISRSGGPSASPLPVAVRVVPAAAFTLDAFTSGGGTGDLCLSITGVPAGTANVILLVSSLSAGGNGPFLGLEITPLLVDILSLPPAPFSILHFPAAANPYGPGPISFPAGTFSALAGLIFEARALAYSLPVAITALSPIRALAW